MSPQRGLFSMKCLLNSFRCKLGRDFSFRIDETQAQSDEDYSNRDIKGFREVAIIGRC